MFSHDFSWFLTLISARTALILVVLVIGLRFAGKRQVGQMNLYDLALIMLVANAVQNAMTSGNGNLSVGIVSATTLVLAARFLTHVFTRAPKLQQRLIGSPTLLLNDGEILHERMQREHVTEEELLAALRGHGLSDPSEAMMAILEVDGEISVVPKDAKSRRIAQ